MAAPTLNCHIDFVGSKPRYSWAKYLWRHWETCAFFP